MITQFLRSTNPGNVPSASSMEEGQLAMNMQDGKIFTKNQLGNIVQMGVSIKGDIMEGTLFAPSFQIASARKLKENIEAFKEKATDLLNSVDVVSFNYRKDEKKDVHVGFIADDTTSVLSGPEKSYMDVNNTLGLLIKGFQEMSETLTQMKSAEVLA